jgi:hypothetical protein
MIRVGASMGNLGSSPEGEGREKGKREGAQVWGAMGTPLSARACCCAACSLFRAEREVEDGMKREKEKKKEKGREKRKGEKIGKISEI